MKYPPETQGSNVAPVVSVGSLPKDMTEEQIIERYECYKRGWLSGTLNQPSGLDQVGTPEPKYMGEFTQGRYDGAMAFCAAMKTRFDQLKGS